MTPEALRDACLHELNELKAGSITTLNVQEMTSIMDYMIIASGRSTRHVKATANRLKEAIKAKGTLALGMVGEQAGEWVLVDFGDVVVNIMLPETRAHYQLEALWSHTESDAAPINKSEQKSKRN